MLVERRCGDTKDSFNPQESHCEGRGREISLSVRNDSTLVKICPVGSRSLRVRMGGRVCRIKEVFQEEVFEVTSVSKRK